MDDARLRTIWQIVDANRSTGSADLPGIMDALCASGLTPTVEDASLIVRRFGHDWNETVCPDLLTQFIMDYLAGVSVESVLDPWAGVGTLLIPVTQRTGATIAHGICARRDLMTVAQAVTPSDAKIVWSTGEPMDALLSIS